MPLPLTIIHRGVSQWLPSLRFDHTPDKLSLLEAGAGRAGLDVRLLLCAITNTSRQVGSTLRFRLGQGS